MNKKAGALILATIATSVCIADMAKAGTYDMPHKSTVAGKTKIYIPGQTAGSDVIYTSPGIAKDKSVTLNKCAWGGFPDSATKPVINITGGNTNFAAMTSGATPTCTAGTDGTYSMGSEPAGTLVKDPAGKIWVKGSTPSSVIVLSVTNSGGGKTKANACGMGVVTVSATKPMTSFKVNGTDYTLDGLTSATNPSLCKKQADGSAILYVPAAQ